MPPYRPPGSTCSASPTRSRSASAATGTYASLAATSVRLADVLNAAADADSAGGASAPAVAALRAMAMAAGPSGPKLTFGSLVGFGAYGALPLGSAAPVAAALPVLALVSAAARLGAGTAVVSNALGATTSPILGATVRLAVAQPGAGSTYAAIGPLGTTLQTAETRVMLTLNLAGLGTVTGLNLPLSVDVGPATASITAIGCLAGAPVDPAVTLGVTPGLVDGWIGTVSDAALADLTTPLNPSAAVLTNLGVVTVSGRAHATVSNTGQAAVPFTAADIAAGTMKSTSTTDYTSSLLSQLIASLQLNANLLGASVPLPLGAGPSISALLQADLQPIDRELSGTLGDARRDGRRRRHLGAGRALRRRGTGELRTVPYSAAIAAAWAESAAQTSSTTVSTRRRSSPSPITRITGSVPEGRIRSRPEPPSRSRPPSMARITPSCASVRRSTKRTFLSTCGSGSKRWQTSLTGRPRRFTTAITWSAATRPSPVVEKSDRMTWPDCSPPTLKPCSRMCSST